MPRPPAGNRVQRGELLTDRAVEFFAGSAETTRERLSPGFRQSFRESLLPEPDGPVYTEQLRHARALGLPAAEQVELGRCWGVDCHVSGWVSAFVVPPYPDGSARSAPLAGV